MKTKWFIFKMDGRWCTVKHYTMEQAKEWARERLEKYSLSYIRLPYSPTFEAAMDHVRKRSEV